MEFSSLADFAKHLTGVSISLASHEHHALEVGAKIIQKEAKSILGHYQGGAGGLVGWQALADSTMNDRFKKGFPAEEPLLRTG